MAKGSGRFRNRKLGFKTRINVEVGVVIEDDPLDADLDIEDDKAHKGVETGVDKDEEGEVHLQQVIASAAAYVGGTPSRADKGKKREAAFIPTRSSQTIPEAEYRALYSSGYVDPISYIRFSDTVEDTQKGAINYTMDEDDEDWLEDFNAQFLPGAKPRPPPPVDDDVPGTPSGRGTRKGGKHAPSSPAGAGPSSSSSALDSVAPPTAALSEDDFEQLMELFEQTTERKAPMAHVNLSLLPRLDDMDEALLDPLRPELARLRPYAREVYAHWRTRRVARGGKSVIPQLDVRCLPSSVLVLSSTKQELTPTHAPRSTTSRTRTTPTCASVVETSRRRARRAGRTSRTSSASSGCATTCTPRTRSSSRSRSGSASSSRRSSSSAPSLSRGARCAT